MDDDCWELIAGCLPFASKTQLRATNHEFVRRIRLSYGEFIREWCQTKNVREEEALLAAFDAFDALWQHHRQLYVSYYFVPTPTFVLALPPPHALRLRLARSGPFMFGIVVQVYGRCMHAEDGATFGFDWVWLHDFISVSTEIQHSRHATTIVSIPVLSDSSQDSASLALFSVP